MQTVAFQVELRRGSSMRRPLTIYVLLLGLVLLFQVATIHRSTESLGTGVLTSATAAAAGMYFIALTWLPLAAILLYVPAIAAGQIVNERRRRTLETLLASPITPAQIVLAKFLGVASRGLAFVIATVPVAAIAMTLGGIEPIAVASVCLVAAAATLSAVAAGIVASAFSLRTTPAVIRGYALTGAVIGLPALIAAPLAGVARLVVALGPLVDWGVATSPLHVASRISTAGYGGELSAMLAASCYCLGVQSCFAVVALALAIWRLRREEVGAEYRPPERANRRTAPLGDRPPMAWKERHAARFRGGRLARVRAAFVFAAGFALVTWLAGASPLASQEIVGGVITVLGCFALLAIGLRAATLIAGEKENGAWDSLLASDLTASEIVYGKLSGNLYAFRWAAGFVALLGAIPYIVDSDSLGDVVVGTTAVTVVSIALAFAASALGLAVSFYVVGVMKAMVITAALGVAITIGWVFCWLFIVTAVIRDETVFTFSLLGPFVPLLLMGAYLLPQLSISPTDDYGLVFGVFLGTIGYSLAAIVILRRLVARFDRLAGRGEGRGEPDQSPRATPSSSSE